MRRALIVLAVVGGALQPARADVIHLRTGGEVEGEIARESETEVELKIPTGTTTVPRAESTESSASRRPTRSTRRSARR